MLPIFKRFKIKNTNFCLLIEKWEIYIFSVEAAIASQAFENDS